MSRSESEIRNNTPVELFVIGGRAVRVAALPANVADDWMREFVQAVSDAETALQRFVPAPANEGDTPTDAPTRAGLLAAYTARVHDAIRAFVEQSSPADAPRVNEALPGLSHGQLKAVLAALIEMSDPFAAGVSLGQARLTEMQKAISGMKT